MTKKKGNVLKSRRGRDRNGHQKEMKEARSDIHMGQ